MTPSAPAVARLTGPGELAAAVPYLCGYLPAESLVLLALHGPRGRLGLTQACPMPPPHLAATLADDMLGRVRAVGGAQAHALLYTDQPGPHPRDDLLDALCEAAQRHDVALRDVLLVRGGRCWSLLCDDPRCCPAEGRAVADSSAGLSLLQAESVAQGRAVLASRAALAESCAGPVGDRAALAVRALAEQRKQLDRERAAEAPDVSQARLLAALHDALQRYRQPPAALTDEQAALLVLALAEVRVRDEALTWLLRHRDPLLALLLELARWTPPPDDASVCACLAWAAYIGGDGALANVALDRALATDPGQSLAGLLRVAVDAAVRPEEVRGLLRETRRQLRR